MLKNAATRAQAGDYALEEVVKAMLDTVAKSAHAGHEAASGDKSPPPPRNP